MASLGVSLTVAPAEARPPEFTPGAAPAPSGGVDGRPTRDLVVRFRAGTPALQRDRLAAAHGLRHVRVLPYSANVIVFRAPSAAAARRAAAALARSPSVVWAEPDRLRAMVPRWQPNDPLFGWLWHLLNTGQYGSVPGEDLNILPAWDLARGSSDEVVAIVDEGVDIDHEDLAANVIEGLCWDYRDNDADPRPTGGEDHGTVVAGLAAARGDNSLGVSGTAPHARFVALRLMGAATDANMADALTRSASVVDVSSNSWGPIDDRHLEAPAQVVQDALAAGVASGRGGKGIVYTWAGGNGREFGDNANLDGYANSRYTIAVGATTSLGTESHYSEEGANIVVSVPVGDSQMEGASGVTSTDVTGNEGYVNGNYVSGFNGTSAAAPELAGVAALILDANPALGWRDVRDVLIATAEKNDPGHPGWSTNGAGYHVNHVYGFGRVDAGAAVAAATTWVPVGPEVAAGGAAAPHAVIPAGTAAGVTSAITIADPMTVEYVEVEFTAVHDWWHDLRVELTSPSGTMSVLANDYPDGTEPGAYDHWRFGSIRSFGESAAGTWTLKVSNPADPLASGTFESWAITVYGSRSEYEAPVTSVTGADNLWHANSVVLGLTSVDGAGSGVARTDWRLDGGAWHAGTTVVVPLAKRGGNTGAHTVGFRSVDHAGNVEDEQTVTVRLDGRPPQTTDDALRDRSFYWPTPVTVHLAASDPHSGVAGTYYAVDGGAWVQGTSVTLTPTATPRTAVVSYFSIDAVGNAETVRRCAVSLYAP